MIVFAWVITALSLIGVWYNIKRKRICFYFWILANIGWVYIDIKAGHYPQAVLFVVYTALAFYGLYEWKKNHV